MDNKGEGLRFNEGKLRYDLLPEYATEQQARIMTKGSIKYTARNWEKGMSWTSVLASLKRHLAAFERGEDYDKESGELHIAHVLVNASFLTEYYKIFPWGDDRPSAFKKSFRIGLDLDGVLCDVMGPLYIILKQRGLIDKGLLDFYNNLSWNVLYLNGKTGCKELWSELSKDKDFWTGLPLLQKLPLPFEPHCYITSRSIPTEWIQEWIFKNNLPVKPIYTVPFNASKVQVAKEAGIDIYVDDKWENFLELNNAGILTFLYDQPWNRIHEVGFRRITSLNDLIKYSNQ